MAVKSKKVKPIPVEEEEELFEELEEIGDEEDLEDLEDAEDEAEDLEEDEEEESAPPRRKAKPVKSRVSDPEDPQEIIRTVLVDGILAYMDQQIDEKVAAALAEQNEAPAPVRKVAKKTAQKAVKRTAAAPARKTTGKAAATPQEVREWLQTNGYEVSERGRISEQAKKFFTKQTGRRVAS